LYVCEHAHTTSLHRCIVLVTPRQGHVAPTDHPTAGGVELAHRRLPVEPGALEEPRTVEREAREQLGLAKPDEQVVTFQPAGK
jgi:hypothetical protein